jgi:hypothetical protein
MKSGARWRLAYWLLLAIWVTAGVLVMMRRRGGWLTSYGDDLALPAWLYLAARNLQGGRVGLLHRTIGRTPEIAFAAITLASVATEISQYFWPHGFFRGVFDPLDIAAYLVGTGAAYAAEKLSPGRG